MRAKVLAECADVVVMRCIVARRLACRKGLLSEFMLLAMTLGWAAATQAAQAQVVPNQAAMLRASDVAATSSIGAGANEGAARRFLRGRAIVGGVGGAAGLAAARSEHAEMVRAQAVQPRISALNAAWQAVGPAQVSSVAYGKISGRVSSIAIDPADATGNTVYVGTAGGGVWKSTNAAAVAGAVTFTPLTDTLPVFSGNAGSGAVTSLSIGALSAQAGGIVLAGTGDPNDALDSYYGGGILRSTDGGTTWSLIQGSTDGGTGNHSFAGLGFAGFAWSSINTNLLVAAVSQSAEGTIVSATTKNSVMGLYVSSDAGVTWQMSTILDGPQTLQTPMPSGGNGAGIAATAVVWNPVRQRFYAALRYHGYYESADGATWTRLTNQPGSTMSLQMCPSAPGTSGSASCPMFRGALAVQPITGDLFALTTNRNNVDQGLWQDVCGASGNACSSNTVSFAKRIVSTAMEVGSGNAVIAQADYNLSLAAVPAGSDTLLFVGTGDLYRCSLSAGCVLRNTTNATNACAAPAKVAPAQHAIASLSAASLLFLGNDSGLWRSTDNVNETGAPCSTDDANHFQDLNGGLGSLAEVISFAQDSTDGSSLLVGLGASGTASSMTDTSSAWTQVSAGEGGTVAIDPTNPMLRYISTGGGVSLHACALGSQCGVTDFAGPPTIGAVETAEDASLLDAPWILDPALGANVLIGTCRVWRGPAASGALWPGSNELSSMFGGPQNSACDPTTNPVVRSLAAAGPTSTSAAPRNSGSRVIYAGMAGTSDGGGAFGGRVFVTTGADTASGATVWQDVSASAVSNDVKNLGRFNAGGFDISSLAADPHDATGKTIYATVLGFSSVALNAPHLYGSTDGGLHWQNLSGNLPNAPANSIVVDPNDANTLYVALDTGVYVTTQVTTCAMTNCWSVYGASLPNAPVVQLSAAAGLDTGDGRVGLLRAGTYGRGIWQIPLLTAAAPVRPSISLSPTSLAFPAQATGGLGGSQTIVVTNTGSVPLLVSRIVASGDFQAISSCAASAIASNASCSVEVHFVPTVTGTRAGILTIYGNVQGGQATASLTGEATAGGNMVLMPLTLSFPTTTINATSPAQNITVSNVGAATITLQAPVVNGDFHISANTCGLSLAPGVGCTVAVVFTPTVGGMRSGSFSISGGAGAQTVPLSGVATTPATDALSPGVLTFAAQQLGTSSAAQQISVTNAGDVALTLIAAQISSGDFIAVNSCGNSLNAHSSCSISVTYAPKRLGLQAGVLQISDQFRTQTIGLNGTGIAPAGVSLSPAGSMSFAATPIGTRSASQAVTLTNNGGVLLSLQSITVSGDFVVVPGGTCGSSVGVGASCVMQVAFAPAASGARAGTLVFTDGAANSPQTLTLAGQGFDFTLTADGSTSVTIANGKSATYPLLLNSPGAASGQVTFTCAGAPANSTCVVSPGAAPMGATTLVTVTVATGVTPKVSLRANLHPHQPLEVFAVLTGLLPLGLLSLRRRPLTKVLGVLAVLCVVAIGGCGSGREIPASGDGTAPVGSVTPAGSYAIHVAATSSSLTRTIDLSLTVQ